MKRSIQGYWKDGGRLLPAATMVVAMLLGLVAMAVLVTAIFLLDRTGAGGPSRKTMVIVAIVGFSGLLGIFATMLSRNRGAAVMGRVLRIRVTSCPASSRVLHSCSWSSAARSSGIDTSRRELPSWPRTMIWN